MVASAINKVIEMGYQEASSFLSLPLLKRGAIKQADEVVIAMYEEAETEESSRRGMVTTVGRG